MNYIGQSLVAIDERVARIAWAKNLDGTVKAYNVYMKVNAGDEELIDVITENEWFSPPLRWDCEYTFIITSTNTNNIESAKVNPIVFVLEGGRPESYFVPVKEDISMADGDIHTIDLLPYGKNVKIEFEVDL